MSSFRTKMHTVAEHCVDLVKQTAYKQLDWTLESLTVLDAVCGELARDEPLSQERLDLWCTLVGAYLGEVTIGAFDGHWVEHEGGRDSAIVVAA
ncbi:hypothetical protein AWB85_06110 [Mycobacteroides immunogenum]|uniref:Uncharacterized protein n=1 Tax=Mycobacteroides immunogenum TaxID=83262 RepID=A0A179VIM4_9MYCO|nr:hypothetical protein [Mycobacteroides immunogenum]OAT70855.1 hypothetical protein AWB85_06110 [Mycobacteroides immunogenum]